MTEHEIKIGTLVGGEKSARVIEKIKGYGFETFAINFWQNLEGCELKKLADDVERALDGCDAKISAIGIYGNSLTNPEVIDGWKKIIENAHLFGTDLVTGFAGGLEGQSVTDSMPRFKEVFDELCRMAQDKGLKIAFENCTMNGNWKRVGQNIAFCPDAWELIFNELPYDNVGLQWEPCHQMTQLIDPMTQLNEKWIPKFFNIHGKDATLDRDILRTYGTASNRKYVWHRTPGFGDSNWTDIISRLRMHGYKGSIDIEGWHDPVYKGDLEYTGQVHALHHLKYCRGGEFIEF